MEFEIEEHILSKYEIIVDENNEIYLLGVSNIFNVPLHVSSLDEAFVLIKNKFKRDTTVIEQE